MEKTTSKNGVQIRLTHERWTHITEEHTEIAGLRLEVLETVAQPDRVVEGQRGALLAVRAIAPASWLVVVYREISDDGFIITDFQVSFCQGVGGMFMAAASLIFTNQPP